MFSGTIRSNLDPFNLYDDARLWDALRRAYLVDEGTTKVHILEEVSSKLEEQEKQDVIQSEDVGVSGGQAFPSGATTPVSRFNLETIIESEGANLSVGERSLLSLARALVKESRVVILDEAT